METSIQTGGFENNDAKTLVFSFAGQGTGQMVGFEWVNFFKDRPVKVVNVRDEKKAYYMGKLYYEDKNTKLFATKAIYLDEDLNFIKYSRYLSDKDIRRLLLWDNPIVQSSTAFFKKDFINLNRSSDLYSSEDYDLWIRLLNIGRLKFCNKVTVRYFIYKNSLSRRNIKRSLSERFTCQKLALKIYFKKYPLHSFLIAIILILRLFIFHIRNFLRKNS